MTTASAVRSEKSDPRTEAVQKVAELINPASENKISANTLFKAQVIVDEVAKRLAPVTPEAEERVAARLHWDLVRLGSKPPEPAWDEMDDFEKELYRSCAEGMIIELSTRLASAPE